MTESQEDYLEIIGFLSDRGEVRVTDIAIRLGVSKPSVLAALKLLEEKVLINHERYGRVLLTEKGKYLAAEIRERHELLKNFLRLKLNVSEANAEKDACRMEHILSEETFELIKKCLKREENRERVII
ncbi:MAG: metal-dependent transcriptional regulator [Treponema sp.]|jgi:DtxR family Mn-dependent transcriptional regulator|nr:metal-dependent transcriptional regulator [Treponema sp.]